MVKLLNSLYLGASTPDDYGKATGVIELLPFDLYLGAATPSGVRSINVLLSGVSPLTLLNAISLNYIKAFGKCVEVAETYIDSVTAEGKCEQASTPTPSSPVDIVCNNGVIAYGANGNSLINNTPDGQGTYATPSSSTTNRVYKEFGLLDGKYKVEITGSYEFIVQYKKPNTTGNIDTWTTSGVYDFDSTGTGYSYGIAIRRVNGNPISPSDFDGTMSLKVVSVYIDGTTETITDNVGNVATCQRLLSVGDYKDTQEILSGAVTRNIHIQVLDGSENWAIQSGTYPYFRSDADSLWGISNDSNLSTHFSYVSISITSNNQGIQIWKFSGTGKTTIGVRYDSLYSATSENLSLFKQWLADQYANGTPVIIVCQKETATTETVSGQVLNKSPVTYAGSLTGLTGTLVESSHTAPKPTQPLDIECNNGVIGIDGQGNVTVTGTQEVVTVSGKNLLNPAEYESVTATQSRWYYTDGYTLKAGTAYTLSCDGSVTVYIMRKSDSAALATRTDFVTYTPTEDVEVWFRVYKSGGLPETFNAQLELGSTATTYEPYFNGGTATCQPLLSVGTYKDLQNITSGSVTRNVGIKVLTGSENWIDTNATSAYINLSGQATNKPCLCTHFTTTADATNGRVSLTSVFRYYYGTLIQNLSEWKQFLAQQYNAGTPVIVVYPLATGTTSSVTAQTLTLAKGTNIVSAEGSVDNLELEVSYKAAVTVTVEEIEAVQLDENVVVTIE